jgi:hypothetical protein
MNTKTVAILDENKRVTNILIVNDDVQDTETQITYTDKDFVLIGGDYFDGHFYAPKPYPSWIRNKGMWEAPIPEPEYIGDVFNEWDEENQQWIVINEWDEENQQWYIKGWDYKSKTWELSIIQKLNYENATWTTTIVKELPLTAAFSYNV